MVKVRWEERTAFVQMIPEARSVDRSRRADRPALIAPGAAVASKACLRGSGWRGRRLRIRTAVIGVHWRFPNAALSASHGATVGAQAGTPRGCSS
jgi:hypothetical protein